MFQKEDTLDAAREDFIRNMWCGMEQRDMVCMLSMW